MANRNQKCFWPRTGNINTASNCRNQVIAHWRVNPTSLYWMPCCRKHLEVCLAAS